ncbi:uncharacterized protein OCT59_016962 [Rhizophagus irregularis]|nr:hypothetical protein OCT59_016962 [Rhizophagus irregularis]
MLNIAINEEDNRVSYLIWKAEILAEIELFYLLPNQRRWKTWFPEVIHYYADVEKTRTEIKRLIKEGEWDNKKFMQEKLLEKLHIENNLNDNKVILEKVKSNDEKLDKLEKLEKLDKFEELEEKLEKLDKLEKLEEKLEKLDKLEKLEEKLEKLLEEIHAK